jgi:hypothetical protein
MAESISPSGHGGTEQATAAPWSLLTGGRWVDCSGARISMKTCAKRRGGNWGVLTKGFSGSGRWWDGLAASFSLPMGWLMVRAALGGSPAAVIVTMGSRHSGDAPWPVVRPQAVAKQRDGVEPELAGSNGEKRQGGHQGGSYL